MSEPLRTYPPEHHFLSALDITTEVPAEGRSLTSAPVVDGVRSAAAAASLGFLTALVDVGAAMIALPTAAPDWIATADLSLHATGWLTDGPATVDGRLVRAGSRTIVVAADVLDDHGARAATATLTFARIPRAASRVSDRPVPAPGGASRMGSAAPPPPEPLPERMGITTVDAPTGIVELAPSEYVANSFGAINGGVLGVLFETAATAAVPDLVAADLQIHYLRQGGPHPVRTTVDVLRRTTDHAVCTVRVAEEPTGERVLATATVTLVRPPG